MNLEIIPQAQRDIAEAARYYRQQRLALADEFLAEVDAAARFIANDPAMFEQVRPGLRRYLLDRFPYAIYYRTPDVATARFIVVRHHRRHPSFGLRRK